MKVKFFDELFAKLYASARIPEGIQGRWPRADTHDVWNDDEETSGNSRFRWNADLRDRSNVSNFQLYYDNAIK